MHFAVFATLAAAPCALAWGGLGHRTVGYLAEKHLTTEALSLFGRLLANDRNYDYSDAAIWADSVKRSMPWSRGFHYINPVNDNPPKTCNVTWPSDCPTDEGCVVSAIANYTSILLDARQSLIRRKNATMFLMHFLGDLHQPLHAVGWEQGGNKFKPLCWKRSPPANSDHCGGDLDLHTIWDGHIAHKLRGLPISLDDAREKVAAAEWADDLFSRQRAAGVRPSSECARLGTPECIVGWTRESNALVCSHVLKRGQAWLRKSDLSEGYFDDNWEVVDGQIGRAGLRLAAWMNAIAAATLGRSEDL